MKEIIRTSGVVVLNNNMVLLVKHLANAHHLINTYGLPAGKIENGITAIETAQKELFEETGLSVSQESLVQLPKVYVAKIQQKDGTKTFSIEVFYCTHWQGTIHQNENKTIPQWIQISSLDKFLLIGDTLEIINDAIKFYKKF